MQRPSLQPEPGFVDVTFVVEPNYAGWRLDRYLCEKIRRLSRTRVQRILERSLVADRPLKPSTRVHPGLTFTLRRRAQAEPEVPEDIVELHLDAHLLVLDKPAGLPIHPTARYHHNTLVKLLERKHGPSLRADPAHRLDRETSGLLVCGRGPDASRALMRAFQSGEVHKEYLAIVEGHPPDAFSVDAPIAEGTVEVRIAVRIDRRAGKPARTRFRGRAPVRPRRGAVRAGALLPRDRAPAPNPRPCPRGRLPAGGGQDLRPRSGLLRPLQQALPRARGLDPPPAAAPRPSRRPARLPPSGDWLRAGLRVAAAARSVGFLSCRTGVGSRWAKWRRPRF